MNRESPVDLTILMPCLNEEETLAGCIEKAKAGIQKTGLHGEVVVADNGSTDGSVEIAQRLGTDGTCRWVVDQFDEVGTPRCGVAERVQRAEFLQTTIIKGSRCAAERGADGVARCPHPI